MSIPGGQAKLAARWLGVWPAVRASLLTVVVFVHVVAATPAQPFNHERLARPEGQRFIAWIERALANLGVSASADAIEQELIASTSRLVELRKSALAPFEWIFSSLNTHQQWGLFMLPIRSYYRLHIAAQPESGAFEDVYRAGDHDALGLAPVLRYRRIRGIYNASIIRGPGAQYDGFARWISGRVFAADSSARAVSVRLERLELLGPDQPPRSHGLEHERLSLREESQ